MQKSWQNSRNSRVACLVPASEAAALPGEVERVPQSLVHAEPFTSPGNNILFSPREREADDVTIVGLFQFGASMPNPSAPAPDAQHNVLRTCRAANLVG